MNLLQKLRRIKQVATLLHENCVRIICDIPQLLIIHKQNRGIRIQIIQLNQGAQNKTSGENARVAKTGVANQKIEFSQLIRISEVSLM